MRKYTDRVVRKIKQKIKCVQGKQINFFCARFACVLRKLCTLKQVGHMVMLTSGSRERKYSHLSGLGQRLMSTSLLLIERSTERLTLTGTKFDPPCCLDGYTNTSKLFRGLLSFHSVQLVRPVGWNINLLCPLLPRSSFWL